MPGESSKRLKTFNKLNIQSNQREKFDWKKILCEWEIVHGELDSSEFFFFWSA